VFCLDTDILSAILRPVPSVEVIRRLADTDPTEQFTTSITLGELLYGAARKRSARLAERARSAIGEAIRILPFDSAAAEVYGGLRAELEAAGKRLADPDLRIASIVLARDVTLVTGNVRHFSRVPGLRVENWLAG
jgi:tRNA(fMet)-specific endonuclease VapC